MTPNQKISHDASGMQSEFRCDFRFRANPPVVDANVDYAPALREHSTDATRAGDMFKLHSADELIYDVTYSAHSHYLHLESEPAEKSMGLPHDSVSNDYNNKFADGPLAVHYNRQRRSPTTAG